MADLGAVTYTAVSWTAGDVITEAKLDSMVANDQAYDSHSAQGLLLNNDKAFAGKDIGGTSRNLLMLNSGNEEVSGPYHSGWSEVDGSWAYASATTITVPSGAGSIYRKGDKIRLKQGGAYKYFYIVGVADTVLTVTGGTDYTVADSAITDMYFSKESTPQGFPRYFSWTPTYSCSGSMTIIGVTTTQAKFAIQGAFLTGIIKFNGELAGTASNFLYFTPPVVVSTDIDTHSIVGPCRTDTDAGIAGTFGYEVAVAKLYARRYDTGNFTLGGNYTTGVFTYPI